MIQTVLPAVSADVQALAEEQGVASYLPSVLGLAQRLFPGARGINVEVDLDPEIANERHIVVEVFAPMSVAEGLAAYRQWNEGIRAFCPGPLLCVFRLSLHQGE